MKKIVIYVSAFVLCLLMFAGIVSAASVGEGYNAEYVLENKTTLIHYGQFNYTNGEDQVVSNAENKDAVNITFVDVDGNVLTKVPMWEYDQEDGKYYSLVWYIVERNYPTPGLTSTCGQMQTENGEISTIPRATKERNIPTLYILSTP